MCQVTSRSTVQFPLGFAIIPKTILNKQSSSRRHLLPVNFNRSRISKLCVKLIIFELLEERIFYFHTFISLISYIDNLDIESIPVLSYNLCNKSFLSNQSVNNPQPAWSPAKAPLSAPVLG